MSTAMLPSSPGWEDPVTRPPVSEWPELIRRIALSNTDLQLLRGSARRRLVDAAQQYTLRLSVLAREAGVVLPETGVLTGDADGDPVVMTGHQPVLFHSGLVWKYLCTERAASDASAVAVSVMIDVDEGDPTAFEYPHGEGGNALDRSINEATLSKSESLYCFSTFRSVEEQTNEIRRVTAGFEHILSPAQQAAFDETVSNLQRLAAGGASPMEASIICRWADGIGSGISELPLSSICAFPEIQQLAATVLKEPLRFAGRYNGLLEKFREHHSIRNEANPFPNLRQQHGLQEMPFWVIDVSTQQRRKLSVQIVGDQITLFGDGEALVATNTGEFTETVDTLLPRGVQIVPRGALVTAFLRLLFADLFVHGVGGGRYDQFTDLILRDWWDVEPPPFTVASATRYLLTDARKELQRLDSVSDQMRDLRFNPQRYFGQRVFPSALEVELQKLVSAKEIAVTSMKSAHQQGQSAKDIGLQIQRLTNQIRATVDEAFQTDLELLDSVTQDRRDAINCRTYPWFLFGSV